jgi:glucosamine-6-phosphate deaminase
MMQDKLALKVYDSRVLMGAAAAALVADKINELLGEQESVNMIFAAAPSQNEFLAALVKKSIDWQHVNAFHMDEYIGMAESDPRTFASFLKQKIFALLPFRSVNYINGNAAGLQAECGRYSGLLTQFPADIVCMGIGENGHIAFNDPHVANFSDPDLVKIVSLDTECRQQQVNDGCFEGLKDVPTHALTLTIPALMNARFVYCMVPGEKKARAVYNTINQQIVKDYPSTILRKHNEAILLLDKNSSKLL